MKSKIISAFLATTISLVTITGVQAKENDWSQFRAHDNVINAILPVSSETTQLDWLANFLDDKFYVTMTNPIIVDNYIYLGVDDILYRLDHNGNIDSTIKMNTSVYYSGYIAYGDGKIFVALGDGTIQAFDEKTLQSLWISENQGGNLCSPLIYHEGYLYSGTVEYGASYTIDGGTYFAITTNDEDASNSLEVKENSFEYNSQAGGYYWSAGTIVDDQYLVFVSTGGTVVIKDLLNDSWNELQLEYENIYITSGICYGDGKLYFAGQNSKLYVLTINKGQLLLEDTITLLDNQAKITATPTYLNGNLYFGGRLGLNFDDPGFVAKYDTKTKQLQTVATIADVQSSILITTGYDDAIYGYFTCNDLPGALYVLKDDGNLTIDTIYTPDDKYQNYNMASAITDNEKVYFTNDSGTIFAIKQTPLDVTLPEVDQQPASENKDTLSTTSDQVVNSVKTGDDQMIKTLFILIVSGGVCLYLKNKRFN